MSGAFENSSALSYKREYVSRPEKIFRFCVGIRKESRRKGAFFRRDPGRGSFFSVHRNSERSPVSLRAIGNHVLETEPFRLFRRDRDAHKPPGEADHKIDVIGRYALCGDDDVAFILALSVVNDDDHFPISDVVDSLFDSAESIV